MPTPSANYTQTGTDFEIIDDESEATDPTDAIKKLQQAVEEHTHGAGRGLAVTRLDTTVLPDHIGARAYNSANISLSDGVDTALTLDSERYDTDPAGAIHSTSVNTSRLTCRTDGKYLITAQVDIAPNNTGYRQLSIVLNGATPLSVVIQQNLAGGISVRMVATTIYALVAGDYVEMRVLQNSGGALDVVASGNYSPELMLAKC